MRVARFLWDLNKFELSRFQWRWECLRRWGLEVVRAFWSCDSVNDLKGFRNSRDAAGFTFSQCFRYRGCDDFEGLWRVCGYGDIKVPDFFTGFFGCRGTNHDLIALQLLNKVRH